MRRNCGRWFLAALLLLGLDWQLLQGGGAAGGAERMMHLLLLGLVGFSLACATGRRGLAVAVCAWWSAAWQWHLAFVPGHEVGLHVWLPEVLAAVPGAWWGARPAPLAAPAKPVSTVAVLSDFSR
ncbi:hypothetical protein [Deinococcus yunweiensis]|uniref:hypothetical protein n=1 Tax=Deinococcus yunweiensis TaxID=367282 RepID=UPI00398E621F